MTQPRSAKGRAKAQLSQGQLAHRVPPIIACPHSQQTTSRVVFNPQAGQHLTQPPPEQLCSDIRMSNTTKKQSSNALEGRASAALIHHHPTQGGDGTSQ